VPAEHNVLFTYAPGDSKVEIIQSLLREYYMFDSTVIFGLAETVNQNPEIFNVAPVQITNKNGNLMTWHSPLENKISIALTDTYYNVAVRIAELATHDTAKKLKAVEELRRSSFSTEKISFSAKDKTAYSCLNKLVLHFNAQHRLQLTWNVLRDPVLQDAFLSFRTKDLQSLVTVPSALENGATLTIYTESARPLADVLQALDKQIADAIIFEDDPHLCSCDVMKDRGGNAYVPRGGLFGISYAPESSPNQILTIGIDAFNQQNLGKFAVEHLNQVFYIHPTEFMAEDEQVLPYQPILQIPISLSAAPKPVSEILKDFCHALTTQAKWPVTLGQLPTQPVFSRTLASEAAQRPAIEYLVELSKKLGGRISWQLLYEPHLRGYVLSAEEIRK
jgi:hypothetical protein